MITPGLIKEQIRKHYENVYSYIEVNYQRNVNKIMADYIFAKTKLDINNINHIKISYQLDQKILVDLKTENIEKQKATDFYYYKSIEYILGVLRKLDEYSYQMEVQRIFSSDGALSMARCNMCSIF